MQLNADEKDDAANSLVEAYKAYRRSDPPDAARTLTTAIEILTKRANFRRAAGYEFNLAELYEQESGVFPPQKAIEAYETAAEWYAGDSADAYFPSSLVCVGVRG